MCNFWTVFVHSNKKKLFAAFRHFPQWQAEPDYWRGTLVPFLRNHANSYTQGLIYLSRCSGITSILQTDRPQHYCNLKSHFRKQLVMHILENYEKINSITYLCCKQSFAIKVLETNNSYSDLQLFSTLGYSKNVWSKETE